MQTFIGEREDAGGVSGGLTITEDEDLSGVVVSPDLISQVTDAVMEEVREWQSRPLERLYPVVFFDALRIKIRDEGTVENKTVYLALGVLPDGTKDIPGIWIEQSESAKFWLRVMTEIKNRGGIGHSDCGARWAQRIFRGHHRRFSSDPTSDLHCSSDPQFLGVHRLERSQSRGGRSQNVQFYFNETKLVRQVSSFRLRDSRFENRLSGFRSPRKSE